MNLNRSTLAAALLLASSTPATFGLVVPVLEDSFSSKGKLTAVSGKAPTLTVSSAQTAYVKFDFNAPAFYAPGLTSDQLAIVTLRIYIGKAKTPGSLSIHSVTSDWSEDTASAEPSFDPVPIVTVPAGAQTTKDYLDVDITAAARSAYANHNNFGFAVVSDAGKLTIPSKEGVMPACQLNMEINYGPLAGDNATFGMVSASTLTVSTGGGDFVFGNNDGFAELKVNGGFGGMRFRNALEIWPSADASTGGRLDVRNTAGDATISLDGGTGKLGIGTAAPEDPLHVASGSNIRMLVSTPSNGFAGYRMRNSTREWFAGISGPGGEWIVFDTTANANRLVLNLSGNLGIGTAAPTAKLDVRGDIKLGGNGQFFASSSSENLRMVRGAVLADASIVTGSGFTVVRTNTGKYTITYSTSFSSDTVVTANAGTATPPIIATVAGNNAGNTSDLTFKTPDGTNTDPVFFTFITVGPR